MLGSNGESHRSMIFRFFTKFITFHGLVDFKVADIVMWKLEGILLIFVGDT